MSLLRFATLVAFCGVAVAMVYLVVVYRSGSVAPQHHLLVNFIMSAIYNVGLLFFLGVLAFKQK